MVALTDEQHIELEQWLRATIQHCDTIIDAETDADLQDGVVEYYEAAHTAYSAVLHKLKELT